MESFIGILSLMWLSGAMSESDSTADVDFKFLTESGITVTSGYVTEKSITILECLNRLAAFKDETPEIFIVSYSSIEATDPRREFYCTNETAKTGLGHIHARLVSQTSCSASLFSITISITAGAPKFYSCNIVYSSESKIIVSNLISLQTYVEPIMQDITVNFDSTPKERSPFVADCRASARPPPNLRFFYDGSVLSESVYQYPRSSEINSDSPFGTTRLQWSTLASKSMNGKVLVCQVFNHPSGNQDTRSYDISVIYGPYNATNVSLTWNLQSSKAIDLTCSFDSNPPALITWIWTLPDGWNLTKNVSVLTLDYSNVPQISPGDPAHVLTYVCIGKNIMNYNYTLSQRVSVSIKTNQTITPEKSSVTNTTMMDPVLQLMFQKPSGLPLLSHDVVENSTVRFVCTVSNMQDYAPFISFLSYRAEDSAGDFEGSCYGRKLVRHTELIPDHLKKLFVCDILSFSMDVVITSGIPKLYKCRVMAESSSFYFSELKILRSYVEPSNLSIYGDFQSTPLEGSLVTYTCSSSGRPPPSLEFRMDGRILDGVMQSPPPSAIDSDSPYGTTKLIWRTTADRNMNRKNLTCQIINHPSGITYTKSYHVAVAYGPHNETDISLNWNQESSRTFSLTCNLDSNPSSQFTWYKQNASKWHLIRAAGKLLSLKASDMSYMTEEVYTYACAGINTKNNRKIGFQKISVSIRNSNLLTSGWMTVRGGHDKHLPTSGWMTIRGDHASEKTTTKSVISRTLTLPLWAVVIIGISVLIVILIIAVVVIIVKAFNRVKTIPDNRIKIRRRMKTRSSAAQTSVFMMSGLGRVEPGSYQTSRIGMP